MLTRTPTAWETAHASRSWRRALLGGLVLGTTSLGTYVAYDVLSADRVGVVDVITLTLFALNLAWISSSFWTAMAGLTLRALSRDPITLEPQATDEGALADVVLTTRTALVMPIHQEDVARVFAGLEATYRSLEATGQLAAFDVFVLSDTRRPELASAELAAWQRLVARVGGAGRIHYRRRVHNTNRKAGNLQDFCESWGPRYENMVVLDADSVMDGALIVRLARMMQLHPRVGMMQTLPIAVGRETFFARFVQFATRLSGPALSTGLAFWQLGEGNYWGHNAIIRVAPFMACCGLPSLPGRAPFGGDILSHDFVEAALMLRGGWSVWLLPQAKAGGSYEEVPSNVVDFAARDRRWCQGNLQHLALWRTEGLAPLSRLHLVMGVFAYVSPLTWLVMLMLSVGTIVHEALTPARYFGAELSLFPLWPVSKAEQQLGLFVVSMALLVLPKLGAMLLALSRREERAGFGGARGLILSVGVELVFAMLLAPVMMLFHSSFVVGTVLRRAVGWSSQARSDRGLTLREAGARHGVQTLIGWVVTVALALLAPEFLPWLAPVLLGLVLSVPLSWASSRSDLGRWLRARGVLLTPEESTPPPVLASLAVLLEQHEREARSTVVLEGAMSPVRSQVPQVPPPVPAPMPAQDLAPGAWVWSRRAARARRLAT